MSGGHSPDRDKAFVYRPLCPEKEEIRLVRLLPGGFDDELTIQLIHVPFLRQTALQPSPSTRLDLKALQETLPEGWTARKTIEGRYLFISDNPAVTSWAHPDLSFDASKYQGLPIDPLDGCEPRFESLSYTWGPFADLQPLRVLPEAAGEETTETFLAIRPGLETALRYLRLPDATRTIWIDAICINQEDTAERDLQIKRMGGIYRRASRVLIWIGPESSSSSLSINTMRCLGQQVEHAVDRWYPSPDGTHPEWSDPRFELPYDQQIWDAMAETLSRPFFQRVWVKQEARLARHAVVQCGHDTLSWNLFRRAIITLREKTSRPHNLAGLVDDARELCNSRYLNDFFWLMLMSRKRKCTDPRDKLYGILSLVTPRLEAEITPRYDLAVVDVYKEAMLAYCAIGERLDLLSHVDSATADWEAPSWVPDWWQGVDNTLQTIFFAPAAGMSRACYEVRDSSLQVTGKLVGEVRLVERAVQGEDESVFEIWRNNGDAERPVDESLLEPFLDLILINSTRERYPTNLSYPSLAEVRERYLVEIERGTADPLQRIPEVRPARVQSLSFIITIDGRLGLAPTQTRPGSSSPPRVRLTLDG